MKYFFVNTFFALFLVFPFSSVQENEWELKKDEEGIQVYTREVEKSGIKEFKAITVIPAPKSIVQKILQDVDSYPEWINDVENPQLLAHRDSAIDFYYSLKLPWPVKDRDVAMTMTINQLNDGSVMLKSVSDTQLVPESNKYVRMEYVTGHWHVTPIDEHSCQVTYQFLADPAGSLPAWVINIFIVDGPFDSLKNLKTYAAQKAKND